LIKPKIKRPFEADVSLVFASEADFNAWQKRTYAIPFAVSELGTQEFWIVQGRIIEVVIEPPKPKKFAGSVVVG